MMVFIHGGAFSAGLHLKHGAERLGDVNDVVVVAINYRIGTLGKNRKVRIFRVGQICTFFRIHVFGF